MATEATEATDWRPPEAEFLRRRLRLELIGYRNAAGLTQKTMAEKLSWSISKVVRIEQGFVPVSPSDVRAMLSLFGVDEDRIEELVLLAKEARQAKSWSKYDDILSVPYKELIGQEPAAAFILKYEPAFVPGLLQTGDYMRAMFESMRVGENAPRLAEVRELRQGMLDLDERPELNFVIGEIALVRRVGSAGVMREQILRLVDLGRDPKINLFLMPFEAGAHPGMSVPFTILQFADERIDDALYLEDANKRTTSSEDQKVVGEYLELFRLIQEIAEKTGSFEEHAERILRSVYDSVA